MGRSHTVEQVFTPSSPASITYIERRDISSRFVRGLRTPGTQIIVYGATGSGKSTMLINNIVDVFNRYILTTCYSGLSFERLLMLAVDELDVFYEAEEKAGDANTVSGSFLTSILGISVGVETQKDNSVEKTSKRIISPQISLTRLAKYLRKLNCCWVLEDFHKLDDKEKQILAEAMKVFVNLSTSHSQAKMILVGAAETARQVLDYTDEMKNRVIEVPVPLMSNNELEKIVKKGELALNVNFSPYFIRNTITMASGLPGICHKMCLLGCYSLGISSTNESNIYIDDVVFRTAVNEYLIDCRDMFVSSFAKAIHTHEDSPDNTWVKIIYALTYFDNFGGSEMEIISTLQRIGISIEVNSIKKYLEDLSMSKRGKVIIYNMTSRKYCFRNPEYRSFAMALFVSDQVIGAYSYMHDVFEEDNIYRRLSSIYMRSEE